MTVLERVAIPCDGGTLLVEDVLSGIDVYMQTPDGVKQAIISIRITDGKISAIRDYTKKVKPATVEG